MPMLRDLIHGIEVGYGLVGEYAPLYVDVEPQTKYTSRDQYGWWWGYLTLGYTSRAGRLKTAHAICELRQRAKTETSLFRVSWVDDRERPLRFALRPQKAVALADMLEKVLAETGGLNVLREVEEQPRVDSPPGHPPSARPVAADSG